MINLQESVNVFNNLNIFDERHIWFS